VKIVEKPVPVEIVRYERVSVPADLTAEVAKQPIPDALSYGDAVLLWSRDRAAVDRCNGRLRAIRSLNDEVAD
jgi:hypothetical protein